MKEKILNLDFKNINMKTNIKIGIGILIFSLVIVGSTYAYYTFSKIVDGITGTAGEINFDLDVEKILPNTNRVDDILVTNINDLAASLNDACLDEDGDFALCQLYKVTLKNNSSDVNTKISGKIAFNNENTPNLHWMLVDNYNSGTTYTTSSLITTNPANYYKSDDEFVNFVDGYLLEYGQTANYYILLWVDDAEGVQDDDGVFSGTIRFEDANGNGTTAEFGV